MVSVLAEWQEAVGCTGARLRALRPVAAASLHVTLCFLGSCPRAAVPQITAACDAAAGAAAGGLALGEAVWLPRRRPRVLAVAIEDDDGALRELQALLAAGLVKAGVYESESRLFFPHVTLARVRTAERVRPAPLPAPDAVEFDGEAVTLYRSHLGRGPAVYEPVHRVALAAG